MEPNICNILEHNLGPKFVMENLLATRQENYIFDLWDKRCCDVCAEMSNRSNIDSGIKLVVNHIFHFDDGNVCPANKALQQLTESTLLT